MGNESGHVWLSVPEVAERLGISASRVRRLVEDRALIGRRIDGVFSIPEAVLPGGEPLAHLAGTVTLLLDGGFTEDSALEWLISHDEQLTVTPVEALAAGRKSEVRRVAQALAI